MSFDTLALDVAAKDGPPARFTVAGQNIIIGRTREAQILLDSATISRRHAEMLRDPFGRWWIRDLGSRNGTHVNGTRITESVVKPGDLIQLGEYSLTLSPTEDTRATPSPTMSGEDVPESTVSLVDGPVGKITSLKEFASPRLAAAHLSMLTEFGQSLLGVEAPPQRLTALCKLMVRPDFHGRSAVILRVSKENLTEAPKPLCPAESALKDGAPYISRTLLRTVLARNEPILAGNTGSSAGAAPAPDFAELSISAEVMAIAAVAVPLKSEKKFTDLLYVILPPEFGSAEWLALAALAVKQLQQADATWAAKKLSDAHAVIERELDQAHKIQERLVPRSIQIPGLDAAIGFIPCRWVGGDYVDIVPGDSGRVLLTVADVCGKGLPAALVASSLHMMTHTAMRARTPLAAIMQNLNVYLCETLAQGTFVTMLAALLDPATGQLETINAGHPPGFFITPQGERRLTLAEANMPLGLDQAAQLATEIVTLEPGTFLVMFTDGLTELPIDNDELLGDQALGDHLSAIVTSTIPCASADLSQKLTALLDALQVGMSQDDRTFLVARRT